MIQITAGSYSFFWLPGNVTHMEVYTSTPGKFNLGMSFTHTEVYITDFYPAARAIHDCEDDADVETHTVTLEPPISSANDVSSVALVMTSPVSEVIV